MPARVPTTTSRSVRCASRGTDDRRRNHYEGSRSYRAVRGGPAAVKSSKPTPMKAAAVKSTAVKSTAVETTAAVTGTPERRVGEAWLVQHSGGQ
jgi:hypothetical protein